MLTSLAVKNTCNAQIQSKGFCQYKTINGIKRYLAIDTLGFPFFTHCTKASNSDDWGLIEMFTKNIDYFKSKPVYILTITILLDNGYQLRKTNHIKENLSIDNVWVERYNILVKNFERTLANATAKLNQSFIRLMLKRLAA